MRGLLGVSGVYDIARHFDYESRRGVHEVSPMQPAMGGKARFALNSPTCIAQSTAMMADAAAQPSWSGDVLLVHGDRDETVPDEQSRHFALALGGKVRLLDVDVDGRRVSRTAAETDGPNQRCQCLIYADGDHVSTVLSLMTQTGQHLIAEIQRFISEVTREQRVTAASSPHDSEPASPSHQTSITSRL